MSDSPTQSFPYSDNSYCLKPSPKANPTMTPIIPNKSKILALKQFFTPLHVIVGAVHFFPEQAITNGSIDNAIGDRLVFDEHRYGELHKIL